MAIKVSWQRSADQYPFDPAKYPFCTKGHDYALDVTEGLQVASKFVLGACQRYLNDLTRSDMEWHFNPEVAEKYLRLVQKFNHVTGHWSTATVVFEPWQCWVWMNIMGFVHKDSGFRRFRIAHVEIARGNGKSLMASQAALYFLCLDNPNGNEISTVATKKEQANIVLHAAQSMARKNASFLRTKGVRVLAHTIIHPSSNSKIRALSSEASSLDGLNDVLAVCDELHAMKPETFDVIYSGMSKRSDSLTLCITTAGFEVDSIGFEQSAYAKKVCVGDVPDDQFFAAVYCIDEDDAWDDEEVWVKANPNLGVSVDPVTIRAKVDKAAVTPRDVPNIKVKHMNTWISEMHAYYDLKLWDACADPTLKIEDFLGKSCRLGIDLASLVDICSVGLVFRDADGNYVVFDRSYMPEDTLKSLRNPLFDNAVANGFLHSTPGAAINNNQIRKDIELLAKQHRVIEALYDPWNATEMSQNLANKMEVVKIAMNVGNLSEPTKRLDALMREGKIRHNGSPLLRWCIGNIVVKEDANQNVFPRKSSPKLKIDPAIAVIMALAGWLQDSTKKSIYEERGIRSL